MTHISRLCYLRLDTHENRTKGLQHTRGHAYLFKFENVKIRQSFEQLDIHCGKWGQGGRRDLEPGAVCSSDPNGNINLSVSNKLQQCEKRMSLIWVTAVLNQDVK